ncbi:hypothetical protein [Myxococcus faecalis]|uniref:hypothetical protein n=1 Tax=Myxococcus faecalis TaxID=3115646 RepID=UPI003CF30050
MLAVVPPLQAPVQPCQNPSVSWSDGPEPTPAPSTRLLNDERVEPEWRLFHPGVAVGPSPKPTRKRHAAPWPPPWT